MKAFIEIYTRRFNMRKKMLNAKPVVKNHLERTAKFKWSEILEDPRSTINKEWDFDYLMNILYYSMLTGQNNLRAVEDFSENYHIRIPDTTLYVLLSKMDGEPLRNLIAKKVKQSLRSHELPKDFFPVRITAIDGKCASISKEPVGAFSQKSDCNGKPQYINRVLRAAHVTNDTKLILGQREIHGKTNEMGEFIPFIDDLLKLYGRTNLLEVISVDAGMISLENANYLIDNGLDYIMALKNPQKKLVELGHELLGYRENCDKETVEHVNGKEVTRKLYRCEAPSLSKWSHLKQFWRIRQEVKCNDKVSIEERYFITSLNYEKLNNTEVIKAIRIHWEIENNANWVFDTVWTEDDSPWCNKAFILVTLLRILVYNIISRLKTRRLRQKNDRERSWKSILQMIVIVLIEMKHEVNIKTFIHACEV